MCTFDTATNVWTSLDTTLPGGAVWSIAETPDGTLWIGGDYFSNTLGYLLKYDGTKFVRPDASTGPNK